MPILIKFKIAHQKISAGLSYKNGASSLFHFALALLLPESPRYIVFCLFLFGSREHVARRAKLY